MGFMKPFFAFFLLALFAGSAYAAFFPYRVINILPPFEANASFSPNFYVHDLWASGHLNYSLFFRNPLFEERSFAVVVGTPNGDYNETQVVRLKPGETFSFAGVAAPASGRRLSGDYDFKASVFLLREPAGSFKVESLVFSRSMPVPADWAGFVGLDAPGGRGFPGVEVGGVLFAIALFAIIFFARSKLGKAGEKALLALFFSTLAALFFAFSLGNAVFLSETGFLPGSPDSLMHVLKARDLQQSWEIGGIVESHAFAYWEEYLPGLHYAVAGIAAILGIGVEWVYAFFIPLVVFAVVPLLVFLIARQLFKKEGEPYVELRFNDLWRKRHNCGSPLYTSPLLKQGTVNTIYEYDKKTSVSVFAGLIYLFGTAVAPVYVAWGIWAQALNITLILLALLLALKFFESKNPLVLGALLLACIFAWYEHFPGGAMLFGLVAACFAAFAFQSISLPKKAGLVALIAVGIVLFLFFGGLAEQNTALVYRLLVGKSGVSIHPVDQWQSPAFAALAIAGIVACFFIAEKRKERISFAAPGALAFGAFALSLANPQMYYEGFARIAFVSSALLAPFAGFGLVELAGFAGRALKSNAAKVFVVFCVFFWALFFWSVRDDAIFYPRATGHALYSGVFNEFSRAWLDEKMFPPRGIWRFLNESGAEMRANGVDLVVAGGDAAFFTTIDYHYSCLAVSVITRIDCVSAGFELEKDSATREDAEKAVSEALTKAPAKKPVLLTSMKPAVLGKSPFAALDFEVGSRVFHYYLYELESPPTG